VPEFPVRIASAVILDELPSEELDKDKDKQII
jgi:hypothetical protein